MSTALLRDYAALLEQLALSQGLDFYPVEFEQVPQNFMLEIAVYGLPVRMPHWSFGARYLHQLAQQQMGLSHIFEVVFPGDPCRAFMMESNSVAENTLVTAHVIGHADFAKNNALFTRHMAMAGGDILERSAARAHRLQQAVIAHGQERVEQVLDAALALEPHIDIQQALHRQPYAQQPCPPHPERDLLWFIAHHAPDLADWERDIFLAVREEAYYFYPLHACQIMNEGWASYWHARLLCEADFLPQQLYLQALKSHSDVVRPIAAAQQAALSINPYHLGFHMWEHIIGRHGLEAARRIRAEEDDFGFIRNYLDAEICEQLQLFVFEAARDSDTRLETRDPHAIREAILRPRYNYGAPDIAVESMQEDGGLVLRHDHFRNGRGLDLARAESVLAYIAKVWRRPVSLHTADSRGAPRTLSQSAHFL